MTKKRNKITNGWSKLLVIGFAVLIAGSASFQSAVALEKDAVSRNKKVKNEIEKQENAQQYVSGQVIIKLKDGASLDYEFLGKHRLGSAKKILKENKLGKNEKAAQAMKTHGLDRIYLAEFSSKENLKSVLKRLKKDPSVEYAEPNYKVTIDALPSDPDLSELWGLNNTGQTGGTPDADINAPDAWDIQTGSLDVVIAVIDTGVDYNHPDLSANIWTNPGEIANNGVDDDGNGFIDDIHGYDFLNGDNDPFDDYGHGTHCAGTIGAVGDDENGIVGVNWTVKIMPIKFLGLSGGSTDAAIASIGYAIDNGANIMSNSWGGGAYSEALEDAIFAANEAGILFVAAAGNSGSNNDISPHYPSSYDAPNVVSVAATDHNDNMANFSCYGVTSVDIGAPGVDIYSTVPTGSCTLCDPSGYKYLNGTSMATPHVAGAAGLIKAQYPGLSAMGIKSMILGGVDPISALSGMTATGGRLNAHNSLLFDIDDISPNAVSGLEVSNLTFTSISLTWIATGDDGSDGTASYYDLRYSTSLIDNGNWDDATRARGEPIPESFGTLENFTVEGLEFDTTYHFALKAIDDFGNQSGLSSVISDTTISPAISFIDDMENGAGEWIHGGAGDNWENGTPASGPGNSTSGVSVWATNLNGNYDNNNMNAYLESPVFSLANLVNSQLVFDHYYHTENYYDGGIVQISTDGGSLWNQIFPDGGYPENALSAGNSLGNVSAYSGYSNGWIKANFDLSDHDGSSDLKIRFIFGTDFSVGYYPGWYLDDLVVFGEFAGIGSPPVADAGGDKIGNMQEAVSFDGSASYDAEGSIESYLWDFGDGSTGAGVTADHIYQDGGIYNVTLVVLDQDGLFAQDTITVTIYDIIPPAKILDLIVVEIASDFITLGWTAVGDDGLIGQAQTYDIRYSTDPINEFNFFLANEFFEKPSPQPSGIYEVVDISPLDPDTVYYFAIKVIDDADNISPISNVVQATTSAFVNSPPVAYMAPYFDGFVGMPTLIDGVGSYDQDGDPLIYKWNFGDNGTMTNTYPFVEHIYENTGTYIITLIVNDGLVDSAPVTAEAIIEFLNEPPVADAGPDQVVSDINGDGVEITLDGSGSYDPDGNIISYEWRYGIIFIGNEPNPIHNFSVGIHAVTLTVTDGDGATATDTVSITVNPNQPPIANAGGDQTSVVGTTVSFDGSGSSDPDSDIASYNWNFGDENYGSGITASHVYNTAGVYTVTLTVTDSAGNVDTDTLSVNVNVVQTMHVENIDVLVTKIKLRGWYVYATATITVVDSDGNFVSGAEVSGAWSGLANNSRVDTTNEYGQVTFNSNEVKNTNGIFTFTVTDIIEEGLLYNSVDNEETSDSVTVIK